MQRNFKIALVACFLATLMQGFGGENMQWIDKAGSLGGFTGNEKIFTGKVKVTEMFKSNEWREFGGGLVEFEKGARSAWHTHPAGQTLIVTEGEILTGVESGESWITKKGDVINCPIGVKHFHGASSRSNGSHIALTGVKNGENVVWLEKVSDEEYEKANQNAQ